MEYPPSHAEERLARALRDLGLGFETQYPVSPPDAARPYKIDIAFPDKLLAIEVEGPSHATAEGLKHDIVRNNFLNDQGWIVHRIHADRCGPKTVLREALTIKKKYDRMRIATPVHVRRPLPSFKRIRSFVGYAWLVIRILLIVGFLAAIAYLVMR